MVEGREVGVEPICQVLTEAGAKIAPSTYYSARSRPPSPRAMRDQELKIEIARVHRANYGVYGVRKVHAQLVREGIAGHACHPTGSGLIARCTTRRLMRELGLRGLIRSKRGCQMVCVSGRSDLKEIDYDHDEEREAVERGRRAAA